VDTLGEVFLTAEDMMNISICLNAAILTGEERGVLPDKEQEVLDSLRGTRDRLEAAMNAEPSPQPRQYLN
jgi:hypothetical protein